MLEFFIRRLLQAVVVLFAQKSGQKSFVITNNKAEGCAPLTMIEIARDVVNKLSDEKNAQLDPRAL